MMGESTLPFQQEHYPDRMLHNFKKREKKSSRENNIAHLISKILMKPIRSKSYQHPFKTVDTLNNLHFGKDMPKCDTAFPKMENIASKKILCWFLTCLLVFFAR